VGCVEKREEGVGLGRGKDSALPPKCGTTTKASQVLRSKPTTPAAKKDLCNIRVLFASETVAGAARELCDIDLRPNKRLCYPLLTVTS